MGWTKNYQKKYDRLTASLDIVKGILSINLHTLSGFVIGHSKLLSKHLLHILSDTENAEMKNPFAKSIGKEKLLSNRCKSPIA